MTYWTRGGSFKTSISTKIGFIESGSAILGVRAFARDEQTGRYIEILESSQEQLWVDGQNQGAHRVGPWETREEAARMAMSAYRKINGRA